MTFDILFKNKLKTDLEEKSELKVVVTDGLAYKLDDLLLKASKQGKGSVFVLSKNAGGSKSNIPGVDLTSVNHFLAYVCYQTDLEAVLSAITAIANEQNAQGLAVDGVKYRAVWGVPTIERSFDMRVGEGIDKAIIINQTLQINYGANAWIQSNKYKLKVNDTTFDINGIIRLETAFTPVYDNYQTKGSYRQKEELQAKVSGFVFTLMAIEGDKLQNLFHGLLFSGEDETADLEFSLIEEGSSSTFETIIRTYSFSSTFENNVGTATLSLKI